MKIKHDFVTNSSSTTFVFVYSGDKFDLYQRLLERKEKFNITYTDCDDVTHTVTVWDVIRAIDSIIRSDDSDNWILPEPHSIDDAIKDKERDIKDNKKYLKEKLKPDEDEWDCKFFQEMISRQEEDLRGLKRSKEKKLDKVFIVGFGDNHGEISGPGIGMAMDYAGRKIHIDDDDFRLYTEQAR